MQAIILAAGMGKRLKELTQNKTKCMVKVNGVSLIERLLYQLEKYQLKKIIVVVGYCGRELMDFISTIDIKTPVEYVENPIYDQTNNIYSLALTKKQLCQDDTLLFESDLIFADETIAAIMEDPRSTLALVDKYQRWMDGTCVKLSDDDYIKEFVPGKKFDFSETENYYKTVNVYKFSKEFSKTHYVPFLEAYSSALGNNEYYEQVLKVISILDNPLIQAKRLDGQLWYEIDDVQDLDIASSLFADREEHTTLLQKRFGGYWRYPRMLDFCYLVNPYFPPKKLIEEMKNSFTELLTQYPSGMEVNSLLAGKNFSVHKENIIVGNGAAELIKSFMEKQTGNIGIIRPTFEEYPNRVPDEKIICYYPEGPAFTYSADDLMRFFSDKDISTLVVVNPDNPTGNYIPKKDVLRLADWADQTGISLVLDESFVDFADEEDHTMIDQSILNQYESLFMVKSISKSYGVPGLRIGVMASGNIKRIAKMKKDVSIWNINSFAEFYMQIEEKYKKDYADALSLFKKERARYVAELKKIPCLEVYPSQANYVMVQLKGGTTARELTQKLLVEHELFVKDLSAKIKEGEYLRFAVRTTEDNNKLLGALKTILMEK